jgi:hypothetical protein
MPRKLDPNATYGERVIRLFADFSFLDALTSRTPFGSNFCSQTDHPNLISGGLPLWKQGTVGAFSSQNRKTRPAIQPNGIHN